MSKFERVLSDEKIKEIAETLGLQGGIDGVVIPLARAVEKAAISSINEKQAFYINTISSLLFRSLLSMQCALIEVSQGGDAKTAIENWIETMIDSYGDDFSEHYTDVKISPEDYFKKMMEQRNEQ